MVCCITTNRYVIEPQTTSELSDAPIIKFTCDYADCHEEFDTQEILDNHLRAHMDKCRYTCQACKKFFMYRINLENHKCDYTRNHDNFQLTHRIITN